jgi:O-antigen ligase
MSAALQARPLEGETVEHPVSLAIDRTIFYGWILALLFGPLAFGAMEPWAVFVLEASAAALFSLWAIRQLCAGELVVVINPLFVPILLFGLLIGGQLVFSFTAYGYATESVGLQYAAYGLLCFLATQTLRRERDFRVAGSIASVYGLALAVTSLFQGLAGNGRLLWFRTPAPGSWIYGPYTNHNHYAGLMEMLFPIPLAISFLPYLERKHRLSYLAAGAVMAATIFLSGSRGGMVACCAEIGLMAAWATRRRKPSKLAMAAFMAALVGFVLWSGAGSVIERVQSIRSESRQEISGGLRTQVTRDAMGMFVAKPALGWGLGTFPHVYPKFRSFYSTFRINEAHNDYAQLLVEMGSCGALIAMLFLVILYRSALSKIKYGITNVETCAALAGLAGATGILVHSFVDFNLQVPANAAWFFVLCTVAAMKTKSYPPRPHRGAPFYARREAGIGQPETDLAPELLT